MESNNLRLCQIWASGSRLYDARTEGQINADAVRKRHDRAERENYVLRNADITNSHDNIHYYIEDPFVDLSTVQLKGQK